MNEGTRKMRRKMEWAIMTATTDTQHSIQNGNVRMKLCDEQQSACLSVFFSVECALIYNKYRI